MENDDEENDDEGLVGVENDPEETTNVEDVREEEADVREEEADVREEEADDREEEADDREEEADVTEPELQLPSFDNMERFGYQMLLKPLESLIMVYPHKKLDAGDANVSGIVGKEGLNRVMSHTVKNKIRHKFNYKKQTLSDYGRIFSPGKIEIHWQNQEHSTAL